MPTTPLTCPSCQAAVPANGAPGKPLVCPECGRILPARPVPLDVNAWYYAQGQQKCGPVPLAELRRLAATGQLAPTVMVLQAGTTRWCPARTIPGLFPAEAGVTPTAVDRGHPGPAAPAQTAPRTVGALRQSGRWLLRQVREVSAATASRTASLFRFGLAGWRAASRRRHDGRARHALGRKLYEAGLGDRQVRAEIAALDTQTGGAGQNGASGGKPDRDRLLGKLADLALAAANSPDDAGAEYKAAVTARAQLREHDEALRRDRAALAVGGLGGWLRAGVGYTVIACVLFLLSSLLLGSVQMQDQSAAQQLIADRSGPDAGPICCTTVDC